MTKSPRQTPKQPPLPLSIIT